MEKFDEERFDHGKVPVSPIGMVGGEKHPDMLGKDFGEFLDRHNGFIGAFILLSPNKDQLSFEIKISVLSRCSITTDETEIDLRERLIKVTDQWLQDSGIA